MADFKDFFEASLLGSLLGRKPAAADPTELQRMRQSSEEQQKEEARRNLFTKLSSWARNKEFTPQDLVDLLRQPRSELNRLVNYYQVATEDEITNFFGQERQKAVEEKEAWLQRNKRNARDRSRRAYRKKFGSGPSTLRGPWQYD